MGVEIEDPQDLGRRIRTLREKRGLSQEELAGADYSAAYISHLEHGRRRASQEALSRLAGRLGMTLEQLVSGRDPDEDLRLEIEVQSAIADVHGGKAEPGLQRLRSAHDRAESLGHSRAVLRAREGIGLAQFRLGRLEEARAAYEDAEDLAKATIGTPESLTTAQVGRARCLFHAGLLRDALHLLESHLIELRASPVADPAALLDTFSGLIPAYFEAGLIDKAKEAAAQGAALETQVPDPESRACLHMNRAGLLLTQGNRRDALASLSLAAELFSGLGWHAESVKVAIARAMVLVDNDDLVEAEALLRASLAQEEVMLPSDRARALTQLAQVRRRSGDPTEGLALARKAAKVAGVKVPAESAEAHREMGRCHLDLGDEGSALQELRKSLQRFRDAGNFEEIARTARLIGDHLSAGGDTAGANEVYRAGLDALGELR